MSDATLRDQLRDALLAEGVARPEDVDGIAAVALHVFEPTALEREVDAFHAHGDLRDRITETLAPLWPVTTSRNVEHHRDQILAAADALVPVVQAAPTEQTQRAEQAERELDDARAAVAEARAALDRASTEMVGAQARLNESTVMHTENAKAITDLSAELDEARAAIARVRRLCEMTIASSCRVQAIDQARDTLAVLDRPEGT